MPPANADNLRLHVLQLPNISVTFETKAVVLVFTKMSLSTIDSIVLYEYSFPIILLYKHPPDMCPAYHVKHFACDFNIYFFI